MKILLTFLALLLVTSFNARGQDSTAALIQRLYLQLGTGFSLDSNQPYISNTSIVVETRKKWALGLRTYAFEYNDENYGGQPHHVNPNLPTHEWSELNFSIGRVRNEGKK